MGVAYPYPTVTKSFKTNKGYFMRLSLHANTITTLFEKEEPLTNYYSFYDLSLMLDLISDLFNKDELSIIKNYVNDNHSIWMDGFEPNKQLNLF